MRRIVASMRRLVKIIGEQLGLAGQVGKQRVDAALRKLLAGWWTTGADESGETCCQ